MLRIVDTSQIDVNNPEIQKGLEIDLRRMDRLNHSQKPANANAYRVTVTKTPDRYRFGFELQYGRQEGDEFDPIGEPKRYNTETLPFLD